MFQFETGKPACPIGCKYCHVTELDLARTNNWSKGLYGINKACTFFNIPPWINQDSKSLSKFINTDWSLFQADTVGWTAVTDGLMPDLLPHFRTWYQSLSLARILTVVSKWPISKTLAKELASIPNLFLVISITGNKPPIEKLDTRVHLRSLANCYEQGVNTLPMCHPYISGVSDLSFLKELKSIGFNMVSIKGLRYNHQTMAHWMPLSSQTIYQPYELQEHLPDDGWYQLVLDSGLSLISPRDWYQNYLHLYPGIPYNQAHTLVHKLIPQCQIASSSSKEAVIYAAISRRL